MIRALYKLLSALSLFVCRARRAGMKGLRNLI